MTKKQALTDDEVDKEIDRLLSEDLFMYGVCYWKLLNGRKIRVSPRDVRIKDGKPVDCFDKNLEFRV